MTPPDDPGTGGWATDPRATRERTCEWDLAPVFCVRHRLQVVRSPEPHSVTVTRTHEATVEWTAAVDLSHWLRAVAEICTPYGRDRHESPPPDESDGAGTAGAGPDGGGDRTLDPAPDEGTGSIPDRGAATDGRFRAAPVDATVRPAADAHPPLGDPYHYWNTPLARLEADDHYPDGIASVTIDLVDGPDAIWTRSSAVGAAIRALNDGFDPDACSRVGLEATTRERFRQVDDGWRAVGEASPPTVDGIAGLVEATIAPAVRDRLDGDDLDRALRVVVDRIAAVQDALSLDAGDPPPSEEAEPSPSAEGSDPVATLDEDPYTIPDQAVDVATAPLPDLE